MTISCIYKYYIFHNMWGHIKYIFWTFVRVFTMPGDARISGNSLAVCCSVVSIAVVQRWPKSSYQKSPCLENKLLLISINLDPLKAATVALKDGTLCFPGGIIWGFLSTFITPYCLTQIFGSGSFFVWGRKNVEFWYYWTECSDCPYPQDPWHTYLHVPSNSPKYR